MSAKLGRKVIITCAVTGAIHTPSMSPHLPVSAQEIADAAIGAAEAGAAIVHADLDAALEELLAAGGVLSRRLLGGAAAT